MRNFVFVLLLLFLVCVVIYYFVHLVFDSKGKVLWQRRALTNKPIASSREILSNIISADE